MNGMFSLSVFRQSERSIGQPHSQQRQTSRERPQFSGSGWLLDDDPPESSSPRSAKKTEISFRSNFAMLEIWQKLEKNVTWLIGVWPFHQWLPEAATAAPSMCSMFSFSFNWTIFLLGAYENDCHWLSPKKKHHASPLVIKHGNGKSMKISYLQMIFPWKHTIYRECHLRPGGNPKTPIGPPQQQLRKQERHH